MSSTPPLPEDRDTLAAEYALGLLEGEDLKRAIEIGGDDVKLAHRYLAGIYMEKGENAAAVKELDLYLKTSPTTRESDQIKDLIKELNKKAAGE